MHQRAFTELDVRDVAEAADHMVVRGIANSPTVDRHGTSIDPMGARFKLPMPLLWHHEARTHSVGDVVSAKATPKGIEFEARLPRVTEDGLVKQAVDRAIHALKYRLVRGVSIGFDPVAGAVERLRDGVARIKEWDWLELSLVTVPSNPDAKVSYVRSTDPQAPAVPGNEGASVVVVRLNPTAAAGRISGVNSMNVQEQIRQHEASRSAKHERRKAIMARASEDGGRTLDGTEQEEYDNLGAEVAAVDEHLRRLRSLERDSMPAARAVAGGSADDAMTVRGGGIITSGRPVVPKGTGFVRYAMSIACNKGVITDALRFAQRWKDSTPEVIKALEERADPGVVATPSWGGYLAVPQNLASEFIELLRAATVLGRLSLRRVPFNVTIPVQTSGSLVNWVGEAAPKPVGALAFDQKTLGIAKVAGILVISQELARLSSPSAEDTCRRDLIAEIAEFLDLQFLSESVVATANNPAGIARGVTAIPATGTDAVALRCDIQSALQAMLQSQLSTSGVVIVMSEQFGTAIGLMTNALGQPEFPGMGAQGGSLAGLPVITSENVGGDTSGQNIYFIKQSEILLADDGGVAVDSSTEATLDMAGSTNATYSLWQRNAVGIKAERFINYQRRREGAVQYISNAAYTACGT